ncbi:F390 synthetase-related protein [Pseudomonas sp. F1_0610]|uniref:F390 synthetase-related protein n=1 Tax=Pseudomonas sp. F1_0610 TaxID=3114284 RepID=UPI0039C1CF57
MMLRVLWHYWRTKGLKFKQRSQLEAYQQRRFTQFKKTVLARSPYFSAFLEQPLSTWPIMNKSTMMEHFNVMNTQGLDKDQLLACAQQSEVSRDFSPRLGPFSVGLSSGTSGRRGLFVVQPKEQAIWAGGMLSKMLPKGLFAGEKVALFLRANNNLYTSVNSRFLSLKFFDLLTNFAQHLRQLESYQPSIIVAPAQVLRALALAKQQGLAINPKKVISVAEVLDAQDKALLEATFTQVGEVYQATEGFLAATCAHGNLHLNEEFLIVEQKWLDDQRFNPIITDFTRITQPIIRYQLDDILVKRTTACPCGSVCMALERIEGRNDDQLLLPNLQGQHTAVFADLCSRVIANNLPLDCDYRLTQEGLTLYLQAPCTEAELTQCQQGLTQAFIEQGINIQPINWQLSNQPIETDLYNKRRRILRRDRL